LPKTQRTREEWEAIKADFYTGDFTLKALAAKYELSVPAITTHRVKYGWINPKTGEPYGATAKQKAATEPVPKGEVSAEMNKEQVDAALADIAASLVEPEDDELERTRRELEEVKAELAALKPVEVEWPFDFDTAAQMLAEELGDMVQMELNAVNMDRIRIGLPHYTVADMDRDRPGWSKTIRDGIIQATVDDLTVHATNAGKAMQKVDMIHVATGRKEQVPVELNIDGGRRPELLASRGWQYVNPQTCHRWDCYGPIPKGDPFEGYHNQLHWELFKTQHPSQQPGATTTGVFNG